MFCIGDSKKVEKYLEEIYDSGVKLSNYFSLDLDDVEYHKTEFSLVIRKTFSNFSRLYFLTMNIDDLKEILNKVPPVSVINIPTRDSIKIFDDILTASGFSIFRIYETYFNNEIKGNDVFVDQFARKEDFERVKYLLYSKLNVYADHLPNDNDLLEMIQNKRVLVNFESGEICGIFIFTLQGKKCYFNFWVDIGGNGLFLIFNMYNFLKQHNLTYSYLWVDIKNHKLKRIHELFGCKATGIKDYIYIKH
jgi:hypothetical protein